MQSYFDFSYVVRVRGLQQLLIAKVKTKMVKLDALCWCCSIFFIESINNLENIIVLQLKTEKKISEYETKILKHFSLHYHKITNILHYISLY